MRIFNCKAKLQFDESEFLFSRITLESFLTSAKNVLIKIVGFFTKNVIISCDHLAMRQVIHLVKFYGKYFYYDLMYMYLFVFRKLIRLMEKYNQSTFILYIHNTIHIVSKLTIFGARFWYRIIFIKVAGCFFLSHRAIHFNI